MWFSSELEQVRIHFRGHEEDMQEPHYFYEDPSSFVTKSHSEGGSVLIDRLGYIIIFLLYISLPIMHLSLITYTLKYA